ncbi:MAG: hypothetical protein HN337_01480 [Deltaproteobacteria bacterium]|jgi:hypothetical protein|nr:hypothetical protein [Deltaproteobacteria bacterium]
MVTKLRGYRNSIQKMDNSNLGKLLFESNKGTVEVSANYSDSKGNSLDLSFKADFSHGPFDLFAERLPLPGNSKFKLPGFKHDPWFANPIAPQPWHPKGYDIDPGITPPGLRGGYDIDPGITPPGLRGNGYCPWCDPLPMPRLPDDLLALLYMLQQRPPVIIIIIPYPVQPDYDWIFPDDGFDPILPPIITDGKKDDSKIDPEPKTDSDPKVEPDPKKDGEPKTDADIKPGKEEKKDEVKPEIKPDKKEKKDEVKPEKGEKKDEIKPDIKGDESTKKDSGEVKGEGKGEIKPRVEDEPKIEEVKPELPDDVPGFTWKISAEAAKEKADKIFAYMEKVFKSKMSLEEKRHRTSEAISILKKMEKKIVTKTDKGSYKDYVYSKLGSLYRKSADAGSKKSPYFDTDGDGCYDTDDDFALNPKYVRDNDGDEVPDKIDAYRDDPNRWENLPVGKTLKMKGLDGQSYLVTKQPDGTIVYKVKVYLNPNGVSPSEVAEYKRRTEKEVEAIFDKQLGKHGIKFDLEYVDSPRLATSRFTLQNRRIRENTRQLSVYTTPRVMAHELGHCIGIQDYYHERDSYWCERSYEPGWECMTRGSLMTDLGEHIAAADALIPGAVASIGGTTVGYA